MLDPIICEDGYTYERISIQNLRNNISPITREPINCNKLIQNRSLKYIIDKYIKKNNIQIQKMSNINVNMFNIKIHTVTRNGRFNGTNRI